MLRISQYPYKRYTTEQCNEVFDKLTAQLRDAKTVEQCVAIHELYRKERDTYKTSAYLAEVRFSLNTQDEFYKGEIDYYNDANPLIAEKILAYTKEMITHPLRPQLEKIFNPLTFKIAECEQKAFSPAIIEDMQVENALTTEYSVLLSKLQKEFDGEQMTLPVLRGKLLDNDREVRQRAACAIGEMLSDVATQLDDIFDRLVKIRDKMAKKMGYADFVELGYYRMNRVDYDRHMVERFRNNVQKDIVPAVCAYRKTLEKQLNIDKTCFYDDSVYCANGNPQPVIKGEEILRAGSAMYHDMNEGVAKLYDQMLECDAFDVFARLNKQGGGYCVDFPLYAQPFIFANFNGSADDVGVICHEFGHALAMYYVYQYGDTDLSIGGNETAECHSMSMEMMCVKYMDKFFGDKADDFRKMKIGSSLCFIPYGVMVDEFQHIVYSKPDLTPDQRCDEWKKLEAKYRPYLDNECVPYISRGTRWQYQAHIYETPFYYIDYCLAQTVALGFFAESERDYDDALARYIDMCKSGGQKGFDKLIRDAGVAYPFGEGTLANISKSVTKLLNQ